MVRVRAATSEEEKELYEIRAKDTHPTDWEGWEAWEAHEAWEILVDMVEKMEDVTYVFILDQENYGMWLKEVKEPTTLERAKG